MPGPLEMLLTWKLLLFFLLFYFYLAALETTQIGRLINRVQVNRVLLFYPHLWKNNIEWMIPYRTCKSLEVKLWSPPSNLPHIAPAPWCPAYLFQKCCLYRFLQYPGPWKVSSWSLLYPSIPHRSVALNKTKAVSMGSLPNAWASRTSFPSVRTSSKPVKLQLVGLQDGSGFSTTNIPFPIIITEGITKLHLSFRAQNKIFSRQNHASDNLEENIIKIQCKCSHSVYSILVKCHRLKELLHSSGCMLGSLVVIN